MLAHVLVPLDGSLLAEEALIAARKVTDKRITLISAINMPEIPFYEISVAAPTVPMQTQFNLDEMLPRATRYLNGIAQKLRDEGYQVDTLVQIGDPAGVILEAAKHFHIDAIVICTHGRSGLTRWLFGSVTGEVLAGAQCPVLVVPKPQPAPVQTPAKAEANPV
jgi:nucleotide-binding universal stress UspA family protein